LMPIALTSHETSRGPARELYFDIRGLPVSACANLIVRDMKPRKVGLRMVFGGVRTVVVEEQVGGSVRDAVPEMRGTYSMPDRSDTNPCWLFSRIGRPA